MKYNAFGAEMDRNGYAPSILQQGERCHMCHENPTFDQLDRHEVFGGAYRKKSKELGLWCCCATMNTTSSAGMLYITTGPRIWS